MAKKYKIYANDQFLGHFYGISADAATVKAIDKNFMYYPDVLSMPDCKFFAQRGISDKCFQISWQDLEPIIQRESYF